MEFAITSLCSILGEDPRLHQNQFLEILGESLEKKRRLVGEFIKTHLPNLLDEWIVINVATGQINTDRRHLVHGFTQYYLPEEHIETFVKKKGRVEKNVSLLTTLKL